MFVRLNDRVRINISTAFSIELEEDRIEIYFPNVVSDAVQVHTYPLDIEYVERIYTETDLMIHVFPDHPQYAAIINYAGL